LSDTLMIFNAIGKYALFYILNMIKHIQNGNYQ